MPPMPPMLILLFLSQNTHLTRTGAAARRSHLLTSIAPHSLFFALALALIAEQRQVGSMRQNAPVDVGAVLAQLHGYGLFFLRKCLFFLRNNIQACPAPMFDHGPPCARGRLARGLISTCA